MRETHILHQRKQLKDLLLASINTHFIRIRVITVVTMKTIQVKIRTVHERMEIATI